MKIREAVASVTLLFELFIIFFLISSEVRIRRAEYQNRAESRTESRTEYSTIMSMMPLGIP